MEPANGSATRQTNIQSVEDFMKEQDEADALKAAGRAAEVAANPTKAQRKAQMQIERVRLEAEQTARKAALEAEKKSVEQNANEAVQKLGAVNWVGKLLEYRNAHPTHTGGLTYAEKSVGSTPVRFTCTALISESSEEFGHSSLTFSNKKDAKKYASKKAIDWLIKNEYMPGDGSVKFPKAPPPVVLKVLGPIQPATPSPVGAPKAASSSSCAAQVPELCTRLGFSPPTYEINKDSPDVAFWSGYAHFGGDPRIEGKVGEVKGVFGKSNAKEQIAMEVLSFLKDIERQRLEQDEKDDEEDPRKRKRESVSSGVEETAGKLVKV